MRKKNRKHKVYSILLVAILISTFFILKNNKEDMVQVFSAKKELPIYSVETEGKKVAVTIDAAWGDEYTQSILDTLDKHDVKATFFLVKFWVENYPNQLEEIYKKGHEIGNHSASHPYMSKLSKDQIVEELLETEKVIMDITNKKPTAFRPPYGDYNDQLLQTAMEQGYYTIQWDIDSLDWKELGVDPVVDRVMKNVKDGSIILFHNNAKYITEYLPIILERLKNEGYEMVTINELIHKDNYYMDNNGRQIRLDNEGI